MSNSYFPRWRLADDAAPGAIIAPDERLTWPQNIAMGAQHVVAMFGSMVLAPLLMGFDPNVAILMSGIGTLIFFLFVGGRVPSYLGSSFAFIGGVIAVTGYAGSGPNPNVGVALGAIIACGLAYTLIGLVVWVANARGGGWRELGRGLDAACRDGGGGGRDRTEPGAHCCQGRDGRFRL
ncbi:uracil permease [Bordetella avium]|nr:uracil permease [Bordetella avium]